MMSLIFGVSDTSNSLYPALRLIDNVAYIYVHCRPNPLDNICTMRPGPPMHICGVHGLGT